MSEVVMEAIELYEAKYGAVPRLDPKEHRLPFTAGFSDAHGKEV